ncbi:MAG: exosortase system-associated protein, TIGR04073 family [Desulfuromonadales bacterium]|nr:exosortase system-associated protein, TIGR04073 family [Desulfuromonadales bacterium]
MKRHQLHCALMIVFLLAVPFAAFADQQPEMVAEKMVVKFTRGVTNTFTSIVEIPKQSILTVRDMGAPGYAIGPLKGLGMTLYRGFIGMTEMIFCLVPQPGYYDSTIDPPYVWQGWEPRRDITAGVEEVK